MPRRTTTLNTFCSVALALRLKAAPQLPRNFCALGELQKCRMPAAMHRLGSAMEITVVA